MNFVDPDKPVFTNLEGHRDAEGVEVWIILFSVSLGLFPAPCLPQRLQNGTPGDGWWGRVARGFWCCCPCSVRGAEPALTQLGILGLEKCAVFWETAESRDCFTALVLVLLNVFLSQVHQSKY